MRKPLEWFCYLVSPAAWFRRAGWQVLALVCGLFALEALAAKPGYRADPTYLIDTWETEDGLPENSATAMVQTPDGYLWFGTWNGLTRFDGRSFTVFNPANTPQLPSAGIVNLHLDRRGQLWVSTLEGLVVRDDTQWRAFGTNDGWAGNYVRTFAERANGDLLLTTFDGHVLEFVGGRLRELPTPPGQSGSGYFGAVDETGQWWVTQRDFVGHWDGQRWMQTRFPEPSLRDPAVPALSARDGGVWLLFGKELLKFRQGTEVSRVPVPQMSGGIWSIYEDSRTNVWICSFDSGLFRLDPSGSLQRWTTTNGLANLGCRFVFEDRERNLWVGTSGGGLTRFKTRRFQDIAPSSSPSKLLAKSLSPASDGGMWMATFDKGLFRHDTKGVSHVAVPGLVRGRDAPYGLSVLEDRAGRVWYGEKDACWWRRGSGQFEKVPLPWINDDSVSALWEDSIGRVWISSRRGVAVYERDQFREFGVDAGLPRGRISCFGEDHQGVPWIAATEGVFRYHQGRFVEVRTGDDKLLPGITCFKADADGTMWLGSRSEGLLRLRNGRLSRIGSSAGFPVQAVHAILEDHLGYFWMPSNRGIVRAARTDLNAVADGTRGQLDCQLLDQHDGMPSAECSTSQPGGARDHLGRLWFATQRGVTTIDPGSFRLNSLPPPVHIEQVNYQSPHASSPAPDQRRTSGDSRSTQVRLVAPFQEPLQLPPGSYGLEIVFTSPTFSNPEKLRFQTRLEGISRDWENAEGERIVRFYQLQPGDFVFRVRAANDDGVWNEAGASLAFSVLPFYWQTVWFRIMGALLFMGCGGGAVGWMVRARLRRALEKERNEEFKAAILDSVAAHIAVLDDQGTIVAVNERWHEFTLENPAHRGSLPQNIGVGVNYLTVCLPGLGKSDESAKAAHEGIQGVLDGRAKNFAMEYRCDSLQQQRWFSMSVTPMGHETKSVVVAHLDITEHKMAESEAQRQRAELAHVARVSTMGELAASVAHELNQPLGAILANAEAADLFLNQDPPALDELRDILTDIRKDDERASEVIRRMRALLRKHEMDRQPLEINSVVEDVLQVVSGDVALRKMAIRADLAPGLPRILGDHVHLQQVVLNLILNGMDAMADQPRERRRILVRTRRNTDGLVELTVMDSGHGIEPERMKDLFEPFFTTKPNGMGMGLSISRTIIEAHRGRIWAENNPSGGATFGVTLPVPAEAAKP